jgi:hypothetical protein
MQFRSKKKKFQVCAITIATYTVQADDEEMGGLGGKHCQGYE